jgi:hypothetical protein
LLSFVWRFNWSRIIFLVVIRKMTMRKNHNRDKYGGWCQSAWQKGRWRTMDFVGGCGVSRHPATGLSAWFLTDATFFLTQLRTPTCTIISSWSKSHLNLWNAQSYGIMLSYGTTVSSLE